MVSIAEDSLTTVDLAIPSTDVVRRLRCGVDSSQGDNAMLVGQLRWPRNDTPRPLPSISAEWGALIIEPANLRTVTIRAKGSVDANGYYQICGVPVSAPLTVRVTAGGARNITGTTDVPASGLGRRDFVLADSSATRGSSLIRLRVVRQDSAPVIGGRASIAALAREVPIVNGVAALSGLPAGTWLVNVRAMGLDPTAVLADAADEASADATITMDEVPHYLEAVTVVERVSRNGRVLDDVLRRQRSASGTFFYAGHPALKSALNVAEVMKEARGFRYVSDTQVIGRPPFGIKCKGLVVYLNGMKLGLNAEGLDALKDAALPADVLAIETYPDVLFTPMQWRTGDACWVMVVWTKY